jgi:tRNA A-37 threonylcarbamoyl transferase component Bud32
MLLAGKGRRLVLGNYRLLRPLGKGGAGSVFLAEQTTVKRRVAVKVLRGGAGSDPLATARFQREGRAAAALDHPNIVRLFDFGVSHGIHYLVMEYLPGVTVQQLLDTSGPLPVPTAVYLVTQTAHGLAHAHARGIVHRDVKPLNLMASDGGVKVLDMGLARALDSGDDRLTEQAGDDAICGTLDYLSPEQCAGGAVDARTDIYSLGVTLFTLLAGRPPFPGSPAEKIAQHQTAPPPALDRLAPTVPPGLARAVERMMAKRAGDRPPTCEAVIAELAPWCPADAPTLPGSDPGCTTSLRTSRTLPKNWAASDTPMPGAAPRRKRRVVYWLSALASVALAVTAATCFALSRPAEPAILWAGESVELEGNADTLNEVAFTADGKRLVGVDWAGGVSGWDARTGRLLHTRGVYQGGVGNLLTVAPDGRLLLCGSDMPTLLYDFDSGEPVRSYGKRAKGTWSAVMSPDGQRLLLATEDELVEVSRQTGEPLRTFDTRMSHHWYATYSPDGTLIAAAGRDAGDGRGVLTLWDAATGEPRGRLHEHESDVRWVAFDPAGSRVATCGFNHDVRVWDVARGEVEARFTDPNLFVERVQFLPNGRLLTVSACDFTLDDHTSQVSVWEPRQPDAPVWARAFPGRANSVAYSPALGVYAVANKSRQVWLLRAPAEMTGR